MIIGCHIYITRNIWIALVTVLTEKISSVYINSHEYISSDQKTKLSKDEHRRCIVRYKFHFQLLQKCLPVFNEDSLCTRYQIYIYIYIFTFKSEIWTTARYNWNIVESGVKPHNPNPERPQLLTSNQTRNAMYCFIFI